MLQRRSIPTTDATFLKMSIGCPFLTISSKGRPFPQLRTRGPCPHHFLKRSDSSCTIISFHFPLSLQFPFMSVNFCGSLHFFSFPLLSPSLPFISLHCPSVPFLFFHFGLVPLIPPHFLPFQFVLHSYRFHFASLRFH